MRPSLPEAVAHREWQRLDDAFEHAMATSPDAVVQSAYVLGGHPVRVRVAGRRLAERVVRPFAHLRTDDAAPPRLCIDLLDEAETGVTPRQRSLPEAPDWPAGPAISSAGRFVWQKSPNTLSCLDRQAARIVGALRCVDDLLTYEIGKPLSRPLLEWHNDRDVQVIHAGLVARDDRGVLFAAATGGGKSTCALACVCAGYDYLGEDFVGLERRRPGEEFVGHSLYGSAFVTNEHLSRFPQLVPYATPGVPPRDDKAVVLLSQVFPHRLRRAVPIRVLVLPRLGESRQGRIRRASKGEALLAVGPSSLLEIPSRGPGSFRRLAELVEAVPAYRLELGRDVSTIAPRVEEILGDVTARNGATHGGAR